MKLKYQYGSLYNLIVSLLGLLLGILLMVMKDSVLSYIIQIVGAVIVVMSIMAIVSIASDFNTKNNRIIFIESIITLIAGFLMFFYPNWVVILILGILLIGFPLYRIFTSKNKKKAFKNEWIKMLIGLFLIIVSQSGILSLLFYIAGAIIVICSVISLIMYLTLHLKKTKKQRKEKKDNEVIDV